MSSEEDQKSNERRAKARKRLIKDMNMIFDAVNKIMQLVFGSRDYVLPVKLIDADSSLDERLKKLDVAKESLEESLSAIEDLKLEASRNKVELEVALERLSFLEREKASAEEELKEIRKIAESDSQVFRKLAGVPGQNEIFRERIIGLVTGVFASVLAAGLLALFSWLL
ncbi:hypothetical protein DWB84_03380 [Saccharophagus sp. K07]|jgi:hypothetical protein|uniref:hypothetical protein n=1 Tax=Saccharophagus sp. K07 TaxID=2283636 RepID=UPI0016528C90|nr:hypothetical protein [Saccharophagus sp. K07]MBC6904508.1 hypothetical protein [Saccharophagus sp. K07]